MKEKTEGEAGCRVGIDQALPLHHVRFQMAINHRSRDDDSAISYVSLKLKERLALGAYVEPWNGSNCSGKRM